MKLHKLTVGFQYQLRDTHNSWIFLCKYSFYSCLRVHLKQIATKLKNRLIVRVRLPVKQTEWYISSNVICFRSQRDVPSIFFFSLDYVFHFIFYSSKLFGFDGNSFIYLLQSSNENRKNKYEWKNIGILCIFRIFTVEIEPSLYQMVLHYVLARWSECLCTIQWK